MILKILKFNCIYLSLIYSSAHAYIDPGTGSIILQAIIAALAASVVFIKIYWHKLLVFLRIKKKVDFENKNQENKK